MTVDGCGYVLVKLTIRGGGRKVQVQRRAKERNGPRGNQSAREEGSLRSEQWIYTIVTATRASRD